MLAVDLFWIGFAHYVGDFVCQNEWMVHAKKTSKFVLSAHTVIWAGCIALVFQFLVEVPLGFWQIGFLCVGHFLMDYFEHPYVSKDKKGLCFDFDFGFHIVQLLFVYFWSL